MTPEQIDLLAGLIGFVLVALVIWMAWRQVEDHVRRSDADYMGRRTVRTDCCHQLRERRRVDFNVDTDAGGYPVAIGWYCLEGFGCRPPDRLVIDALQAARRESAESAVQPLQIAVSVRPAGAPPLRIAGRHESA